MIIFVPKTQRLTFLKYCRLYRIKFKYLDQGVRLFYRITKLHAGQDSLLDWIVEHTNSQMMTDAELDHRRNSKLGCSHSNIVELPTFVRRKQLNMVDHKQRAHRTGDN